MDVSKAGSFSTLLGDIPIDRAAVETIAQLRHEKTRSYLGLLMLATSIIVPRKIKRENRGNFI